MSPVAAAYASPSAHELNIADLYATDVDVAQLAMQMGAGGAAGAAGALGGVADMPGGMPSWESLFTTASADVGGFTMGGPFAGGDVTGMMGDECLAAMMGLGNEAWFMPGN